MSPALLKSIENEPDQGAVLTKAVLRAAQILGLTGAELAQVIGVSPASVSRLRNGLTLLSNDKSFELGAMLVRVFRSLDAILGGDSAALRIWMRAKNSALGAVPAERMKRIDGLVQVLGYLDARRAPL